MKTTLSMIALIVAVCGVCQAKVITVGAGSYTDDTTDFDPKDHGPTYTPLVTEDASFPYPTTDWWTSILADIGPDDTETQNLFALPLAFKCDGQGLLVDRPELSINNLAVMSPFTPDMRIGLAGVKNGRVKAAGWGDFTVDICFPAKENNWTATIGHGLPFAYATFTGGTPEITFLSEPKVVRKTSEGLLISVNDVPYGIYFVGDKAKMQDDTLSLAGCTYLAVAALPGEVWFEKFRLAAFQKVTDSRVDYSYDVKAGEVKTTYKVITKPMKGQSAPTYMALYPHHYKKQNFQLTDAGYDSVRGKLKVLHGNKFTTVMPFYGIVPFFPEPTSKSYDPRHLKKLLEDVAGRKPMFVDSRDENISKVMKETGMLGDLPLPRAETYFTGKQLAHIARLIPIADLSGNKEIKNKLLAALRKELVDWFTATPGEKERYFYYDRTCGGLIGMNSSFWSYLFGDLHYHYGHFVYAAAIVSMYDENFKEDYGPMVEMIIHAYNSPDRDNPMFPRMRAMDPYAGHCWAVGVGSWSHEQYDFGNEHESTSESIHAWQAIFLWGMVTGNDRLRDYGAWGYVTEASAIHQYNFDVDDEVYTNSDEFGHDFVALLYGGMARHPGYFMKPTYTFGIQYLPVTPGSLYLSYDPDAAEKQYADFLKENGGPEGTGTLFDHIWMFQAMFDPDAVLAKYDESVTVDLDGNSFANVYRWIHFFKGAGQVDVSVSAPWPYYSAFRKGDTITVLAYNPGSKPVEVPFKLRTSGTPLKTLTVAPGAVAAGTVDAGSEAVKAEQKTH